MFIELSAFSLLKGDYMILHNKKVDIHVDDIEPFVSDVCAGFKILWSGNIGWGEYTLYKKIGNNNEWFWDDEYMENPKNDKTFLKLLFDDFAKQLEVE